MSERGYTKDDLATFLYFLLEHRGDFGRLLLVLADVERRERGGRMWFDTKAGRKRVREALEDCLRSIQE